VEENMASDNDFVEFVAEQMQRAGEITYRKMFGEYAVYCDGKVIALVCDNQLFVKPTTGGKAYIGEVVEAPPYPSAKMYFLIEDKFEDRDWLSELVKITAGELPEPKPKIKKKKDDLRKK
jgi:TfoX/Sxy family transcriptional regulator of competence genes